MADSTGLLDLILATIGSILKIHVFVTHKIIYPTNMPDNRKVIEIK